MDGIRINQKDRRLLTFIAILIAFISVAGILTLYFVIKGGRSIADDMEDVYPVLIPLILILLLFLTTCFLAFMALVVKVLLFSRQPEKDVTETTPEEIRSMSEDEKSFLLQKLNEKKERIEYLIKLAEEKYYKRKLDQESFREITRDNQKKLMEIEVRIREIDKKLNDKGG